MNQKQTLREIERTIWHEQSCSLRRGDDSPCDCGQSKHGVVKRLYNLFLKTEEETVKAVLGEDDEESELVRNGGTIHRVDMEIRNKLRTSQRLRYSQIRKARE